MDTLLTNGRVYTMAAQDRIAEAVGLAGGQITFVGSNAEAERLRDSAAEVLDLGGRSVCPGLIDAHNHFSLTALEPVMVDCGNATSAAEIQNRVGQAAAEAAPGRWIRAFGYDETKLPGRRHLSRDDLDAATTDHPVALIHWSYHRIVANSAALALAGIDERTPEPDGGKIDRTAGGRPTGLLFEAALGAIQRISLEAYLDQYGDSLGRLFTENAERHLALGITTVHDALVTPTLLAAYDGALEQGALALNVRQFLSGSGFFDPPLERLGDYVGRARGLARVVGIKLFMDGGGNSIALAIPVNGHVRETGSVFYSVEEIVPIIRAAHERGLQVAVHACGNRAIEGVLRAFDLVQREGKGAAEPRHRIEHDNCPTDEQIDLTRDLGVSAVIQPVTLTELGDLWLRARIPPAIHYIPIRRQIEAGVTVAGSSDYPCFALDPIAGMAAAATRQTAAGEIVEPEERVDGRTALALYTRAAARTTFDESRLGTIEPGKQADIVVLDGDPAAIGTDQPAPRVSRTYLAGVCRFEAPTRR